MGRPRFILDRAYGYVAEAAAFLRRRKKTRQPFAQVYWRGGRGYRYGGDDEAGRELFAVATELAELARGEAPRG